LGLSSALFLWKLGVSWSVGLDAVAAEASEQTGGWTSLRACLARGWSDWSEASVEYGTALLSNRRGNLYGFFDFFLSRI